MRLMLLFMGHKAALAPGLLQKAAWKDIFALLKPLKTYKNSKFISSGSTEITSLQRKSISESLKNKCLSRDLVSLCRKDFLSKLSGSFMQNQMGQIFPFIVFTSNWWVFRDSLTHKVHETIFIHSPFSSFQEVCFPEVYPITRVESTQLNWPSHFANHHL